jgi:two-component system, NarL family, nitrate/nitrite response regulator NarL
LQMPSPKSQNSSFRSAGDRHWISPTVRREDGVLKISPGASEPMFHAVIVDRDSMSGDLLANALLQDKQCKAVTTQPAELLRSLSLRQIDLVVISAEVQAHGGDGFSLAATVGRSYPNVGIVILLHTTTYESVIKAFRSGARGVFSRQQPITEFFDCVEHVRKGYIWAGKEETTSLVEAFKSIPTFNLVSARDHPTLTSRELQVVHAAAKGKTNKAIANELNLSEHTIKNYLFRAFEKLGVSSRVELLFYLTLQRHIFGAASEDALPGEAISGIES